MNETIYLKSLLKTYEEVSGQVINYQKSNIAFSPNTSISIQEAITTIIMEMVVSCYEKYLGLPTVISRNKRNIFDLLIEKVSKKVGGWRAKYFSAGGKEISMKSVKQVVPTYMMVLFKILKGIIHDLNKILPMFGGEVRKTKGEFIGVNGRHFANQNGEKD